MRTIVLTKDNVREVVDAACRVLLRGGVVAFPTETSYGLGADATNPRAVANVFRIKGRDRTRLLSVLVSSVAMARRYACLSAAALRLWRAFLPGPLTIVAPGCIDGTIGLRVSSHPFASALVRAFGAPITATSANVSGTAALRDAQAIVMAFSRRRYKPDLVIDAGSLPRRRASTVVDCSGESVRLLRKGPVSHRMIQRALQ